MDGILRLRRMAALVRRAQRRDRIFRDHTNPLDLYNDVDFHHRYRFTRQTVVHLMDTIHEDLQPAMPGRLYDLTPTHKTLQVLADLYGMSIASASRVIHQVSQAIARRKGNFITFPTEENLATVRNAFYESAHCPHVIGAIDCRHIHIQSPGGEEAARFINRKGYYSINVQVICDAALRITNIVARWPGSTHDSRIFQNSTIATHLRRLRRQRRFHILGDGGYPCLSFLMTPLRNRVVVVVR